MTMSCTTTAHASFADDVRGYKFVTVVIDDEEKVSGNIMKSKVFKDSKFCSKVDLSKSEGDSSALLNEIEKVIKAL